MVRRRGRTFRHLPGLIVLSVIGAAIASLPVWPFALHLTGPAHPAYARYVPPDGDGVFLSTHHGEMELFPWSFPLGSFPSDAPIMHAGVIQDFLISRPALDLPNRYSVIDLRTQHLVPFHAVRLRNGHQMRLIPNHPIPPGHYLFLSPTSGMDGGYIWCYFGVTASGGRR